MGRLEEALPLAEESLALDRRLWAGVGGVHSDVSRGLNNLSQVYQGMGRVEEALPLAEEAVAMARAVCAGLGRGAHGALFEVCVGTLRGVEAAIARLPTPAVTDSRPTAEEA
jgi:hypothetical protein